MENSRETEIRQQIDAYIKGQLSEEEIQALWNEFAKNPELLDVLEVEVNVKELIEREALNSKPDSGSATITKLPSYTWHVAAAAVFVIIALVQIFRIETPTQIDQFVINQIGPDQVETSDGVRAKDMRITTADSLLNLGFEAIVSGNEDRALELFDEVINRFDEEPYGSKAFLNKGIILYNESNYEEAISAFREAAERVEDSRMILEKAYWYMGNALVNVGELEEAQKAVFEAYQLDGMFRKPAFRLLKKLSDDLGSSDYEGFDAQQLE
ncbi:tetratricopeptide repeat protein [Gracilimonas sediminicola]|uniref:Tetratricopeptide repeat protein n=1 Tax=Gracilimonas sediminicola TaxID=2952158 RepID=A0A9X2RD69_9BACT|nr:tetratricopeptide repeat protein [Gracilimonas sediminicola]MCP9291175.1 tetratricopeptide repeat protein [Gracilimonas sediminicola]